MGTGRAVALVLVILLGVQVVDHAVAPPGAAQTVIHLAAAAAILVVGLTIANPTLWMTAFSLLVTIVPLWRTGGPTRASAAA